MRNRPISFLWITSAWSSLDHDRDTTLRLMQESLARGYFNVWCEAKDLCIRDRTLYISGRVLEDVRSKRQCRDFSFGRRQDWTLDAFQSVQVRIDPPLNVGYQQTIQMLQIGAMRQRQRKTEFVNPLYILLGSTSKLEPLISSISTPPTLVSRDWKALKDFGRIQERTILKPLNSFCGLGIRALDWRTPTGCHLAKRDLQAATSGFTEPVLLQHYLEGELQEVRVWFLDGAVLGFGARVRSGASDPEKLRPASCGLTCSRRMKSIGRYLAARGIRLAAVDLLGSDLLEINFTSPGLLVELELLHRTNFASKIITALAKKRTFHKSVPVHA